MNKMKTQQFKNIKGKAIAFFSYTVFVIFEPSQRDKIINL